MTDFQVRVAMIIQDYHPIVGGAERQLATIAPHLQARGVDVHIITRRYPGLVANEMINNIPVHRLLAPKPKPVASVSFTLGALNLIRRLKPDVLHAYNLFSPSTTAITAKRLFGIPVAVKVLRGGPLGDLDVLRRNVFSDRRLAAYRDNVDAFLTISQEIDQELNAVGVPPQRRFFIPNGVDSDRFAPIGPDEKRTLRASLDLPDVPIAVFTGRLVEEKRVHHLINTWPDVRAAHPDALLLIVGTGREEAALKDAAGSGIRFVGKVEDVAPYLKAADIFVLPSATEGLSNALLEGLAAGLSAVATEVGGAGDVITHGHNGWLIPPDDVRALREALIKLIGDPEYRIQLGQHGREKILQDYRLEVVTDKMRALYDQLIRQRKGQPVSGAGA